MTLAFLLVVLLRNDKALVQRSVAGTRGPMYLFDIFLAVHRELRTTVLLPAGLVLLGAELLFFAVADHSNA